MRKIDDAFIIEYQITAVTKLGKRSMGGTDELFAWKTAPAFYDILSIANPASILEFGYNAGHSALMFLMINPNLIFEDVDIADNPISSKYLFETYPQWGFTLMDTRNIKGPAEDLVFCWHYDMFVIDADHSDEAVVNDIEKALLYKPQYILLDDYRHPSHNIEKIVVDKYLDRMEVVKVYEFNEIWQGYSMCLCKVKY